MRFHVGFSFRGKVILKWLGAIGLALLSYFGISQLQVVYADDLASPPSNCQTGSTSDMVCNAFDGYYSLSDTTNNQCNIFLGDITSLNLRTRQVEAAINYTDSSLSLTQTSSQYSGTTQSNMGVRFFRGDFSYELYLSYKVSNLGESLSCKTAYIHSSCDAPAVTIYYCPTNSFASNISDCYQENIGGTRTGLTAYDSDTTDQLGYRVATKENFKLKTNAEIHQVSGYNNNLNYDYIQITYNTLTAGTNATPNIGAFWEYYGLYFGDQQIDNDWTTKSSNYCSNTGGPNWSGGGNSVLDKTTEQIISEVTNSDAVNGAKDQGQDLFETEINQHGIVSIITAPITLLQGILNSSNSCDGITLPISIGSHTANNVSLPSGCIIWDEVPTSIETLYHVLCFGLVAYFSLTDVVKLVNDLHDPDKKNDYTMDL